MEDKLEIIDPGWNDWLENARALRLPYVEDTSEENKQNVESYMKTFKEFYKMCEHTRKIEICHSKTSLIK